MTITQRSDIRVGLVLVAVLAVGLVLGWGGGRQADAGQQLQLAKLVNLDQIPVGVGDGPAMWTHVLYVKRVPDGRKMTQVLNELNATMAERGWTFLQLMPHLEDADLKGIWLVYRATGWGPRPDSSTP